MIIYETERLNVCEITAMDAAFILAILNTPAYHKYIGDRKVRTIKDAEEYINKIRVNYEKFGFGYYTARLKSDDTILGFCGIMKRDELDQVDIGFAFLPEYEGKGYGYEAAYGLMRWGEKNHGIKKFVGITLEINTPSIKLLEKLGLKFERKILMENEELLLYS